MIFSMRKGRLRLFLFFCLCLFPLFSQSEDYALSGPIYGKNYYLPHLPVYSFPGFSPRSGQTGDRYLSAAYTGINEFVVYDADSVALDYESSVLDLSYQYRYGDNLLFGAEGRLISYYGGFMDRYIETFHGLFGFPNAGRELFGQDDLFIDMDNRAGEDLYLDSAALSLGDTDIYAVWTFYENRGFYLALAGAFKLPTGSLDGISGSGWADAGVQILGEWAFHPRWSLHLQEGIVIPGDWVGNTLFSCDSYAESPVSQTFVALQFAPRSDWRIISQFRINTSPISSERERTYTTLGTITLYTLPQTAYLMGVKKSLGDWVVQMYFEEDPFTYEGADILGSLRVSRFF